MLETESILENVETYTYYKNEEENPLEVLLVGVDSTEIGDERNFQPPGFNRHHITTWLRKRYFFLSGTLYAQIPRRTVDFPEEAKSQLDFDDGFATDICFNNTSNTLSVFYPISTSETLVLSWNIGQDDWSMGIQEIPIVDGNVDPSYFDKSDRVWTSP